MFRSTEISNVVNIYIAKGNGDSTDPCRTPKFITKSTDQQLSHLMHAQQPENKFSIKTKTKTYGARSNKPVNFVITHFVIYSPVYRLWPIFNKIDFTGTFRFRRGVNLYSMCN